jgi:hypothetical protein
MTLDAFARLFPLRCTLLSSKGREFDSLPWYMCDSSRGSAATCPYGLLSFFLQKLNVGHQTQCVAWYQLGGFRTPVMQPPHWPVYLHMVLHHISSFSIHGCCYHNHEQSTFQVVAVV